MAYDTKNEARIDDAKEVIQTFARASLDLHVANGLITDTVQLRQWVSATIHHGVFHTVRADHEPESPGFLTALADELQSVGADLMRAAHDLRAAELRPPPA